MKKCSENEQKETASIIDRSGLTVNCDSNQRLTP